MAAALTGALSNRRAFISGLLSVPFAALPIRSLAQDKPGYAVRVQVQPQARLGRIATDFMGLGYEVSSVSERGLLSGSNQAYVQFVRTLGPRGVIRIGGNTSDYHSWSPDGPAVSSPMGTVVDRRALADLGTFLRATGWRLIWGLNLGQSAGRGTMDQVVDEAVAVAATMGGSLLAFEIGNEPDLFPGNHRPGSYSYADYYAEYSRFKKAIRNRLPNAPFAGPDVFVETGWLEKFAATEAADIQMLTQHYYAEGPPENPASTIENLLKPNEVLTGTFGRLESASRSAGVRYRICETNSCFGGGKPGVSDTMAASLWGLDFLFTLAQFNAAGVNLETGVNQLGFVSWYSPVIVDSAQVYRARPLYYGMLAFQVASHGDRVKLTIDTGGLNMTAYAVRADNSDIWLTLVNKEVTREAHVRATCPGIAAADALRLTAPSLSSKDGLLLGGSPVSSAGKWAAGPSERVQVVGSELEVGVPAGSAAMLRLH
jgi:Glycosyl hydrolase family 79, N-terminal domain